MNRFSQIMNVHLWAKEIRNYYYMSGISRVYHTRDDGGRARLSLLEATIVQAVVGGFSGGVFYTGLLVEYGINIVNISIITVIPYICSLFSLFNPYIFERFQKRKNILSVSRIAYYVVNIIGITLLPQLIQSEGGRVLGLIGIVFLANMINFLFSPAYSPWHMTYLTDDVRMSYFSSTTIVSNVSSSIVLILASILTDRLEGQARLNLIIIFRYASFAAALLDVYFLQKPKEPHYAKTSDKPRLADIIRLPLSNKKFALTMLIFFLYAYAVNLANSVINAWLLEDVHVSYLYINIINAFYSVAILATSGFWNRVMKKNGTFVTLMVSLLAHAPTYIAFAYVNHSNYLWLMTLVRLTQHILGAALVYSANNLIYVNLPPTDQTNYLSFYTIVANAATFLGMMTGTWVVAGLGSNLVNFLGYGMTAVPLVLYGQGIAVALLAGFIWLIRGKVEPDPA